MFLFLFYCLYFISYSLMRLFLIIFRHLWDRTAKTLNNMRVYIFYLWLKIGEFNKFFLGINEVFYKYTEDKGLFLCLFYVSISFFFIIIIATVFYTSCPIFLAYSSKVILMFLKGIISVRFKFKFFEVNTYLITLFAYIIFFFIFLFFMFLYVLYFYLFVLVFYYSISRVFFIVKSYWPF